MQNKYLYIFSYIFRKNSKYKSLNNIYSAEKLCRAKWRSNATPAVWRTFFVIGVYNIYIGVLPIQYWSKYDWRFSNPSRGHFLFCIENPTFFAIVRVKISGRMIKTPEMIKIMKFRPTNQRKKIK